MGDDEKTQRVAIESHAAALVVVSDHTIRDELLALAKEHGVSVVNTDMDVIHVSRRIYLSIPVRLIMVENPVVVHDDEYVDDLDEGLNK